MEPTEGLHTIEALFVTEHLVVRGALISPEGRLSDHLNSSAASLETRPTSVDRVFNGGEVDLSGTHAHVPKAHLLFVVPMVEPEPRPQQHGGMRTSTRARRCWASFGRYSLTGKIHVEVGRDLRLILRSMEQKQFLPFTEVTITQPDGSTCEYSTVIVNRSLLELLALGET